MIGITLSSEQIRTAPAEVRRWIEAEVSASLGLPAPAVAKKPQQGQLAACSAEEVAAILAQVQGVLPVVNVLFEFGRRGAVIGPSRVEAFRLLDIAQHTRLQNINQVVACLNIINEVLGRIRGDGSAQFCAFDRDGHCFVALETQENILHLWQDLIAGQQLGPDAHEAMTAEDMPSWTAPAADPRPAGPADATPVKPMATPVFSETEAAQP
jgi:hypothetical protein